MIVKHISDRNIGHFLLTCEVFKNSFIYFAPERNLMLRRLHKTCTLKPFTGNSDDAI